MEPPDNLSDCRSDEWIAKDHELANECAQPGTVKHFMLRQGFMPHDEQEAEGILVRIIRENEWFRTQEWHRK